METLQTAQLTRIDVARRLFSVPLTRITSVPKCAVSSVGFLWGPPPCRGLAGFLWGSAEAPDSAPADRSVAQLPETDAARTPGRTRPCPLDDSGAQPAMALPGPTPVHALVHPGGLRVIQQRRPHFGRDPAQLVPLFRRPSPVRPTWQRRPSLKGRTRSGRSTHGPRRP
jgi:hypothetical protein